VAKSIALGYAGVEPDLVIEAYGERVSVWEKRFGTSTELPK
jgi:hypothetical protein